MIWYNKFYKYGNFLAKEARYKLSKARHFLAESKKLFIFDMDGRIYLGGSPFDFALRYIEKLREQGMHVLFFTNNVSHITVFYQKSAKSGLRLGACSFS